MTRPIKFRVWDKERKIMEEVVAIDWAEGENGLEIITCYTRTKKYYRRPNEWGEQTFEIIEFTGLLDKNGVEIYEDYVIRVNNLVENWKRGEPEFDWRVLRVWWNRYTWSLQNKAIARPLTDYDLRTLEPYELEVIGNIYENPDLL